jgi:hypothetical protein
LTEKRIAILFENEPWRWGLRGDPFLWQEIVETIGKLPLPATELQFIELLNSTFDRLVGHPITHQQNVYIERYAHGGMSSGCICPEFWREKAFPLLRARYSE